MRRETEYKLFWETDDDGDIILTDTQGRIPKSGLVPLTRADLVEMLADLEGKASVTKHTIVGG